MKTYLSKEELQKKYLSGASKVADCVTSTMGPKGATVLIKKKEKKPYITKDGVTVCNFFELEDPVENAAVAIIRQAADETATNAGDGTTTAVLLATEIYREATKYLLAGVPPITLKEQIEDCSRRMVQNITERAIPLKTFEDVKNVAVLSANNDQLLGSLIGNAIDKIGKDGSVVVEEAKSLETTIEFIEGFRFDSGLISKSFYTDEHRGMLVYEKPLIMITDENLTTVDDIYPALQLASRDSRPLIIIANEVSGQAQAALVMNVVRGTMRVAAIKPPRYGEERINILEDLAIATGGKMISRQYGLTPAEIKLEHFGTCQTVESSLRATTFVGCGGNSELIEKQIEDIKQIVRSIEDVNEAERQQERVTRLSSTVAIIRVGGFTEAEVIEKKHRIEDALEAVKAAQESGIVVGGGVSYLLATKKFDEFGNSYGEQILKKAMRSPVLKLASNAGQSGDLICEKIVCSNKQDFGYDFRDNKFKNLRESGIIEPAKVQIEALQNAVSAAVSLIFSSYAVIEI